MKKIFISLFILTFFLSTNIDLIEAKGGRGGGGRSSSRSSSSPKTPAQIKAEKAQAARIQAQKAQEAKYQQAASKKPSQININGKSYKKGGTIGVNGYSPRFKGGYTAPPGSVVYYRDTSSAWDWFPMYYIMTHNGNQQAVVQQPDRKEQAVEEEGSDGMYYFNWFLTILLALGLIGLIVYFINKATQKGGEL